MTIQPYVGEFLISPIPLELSLHHCSHACAYCFANINLRDRRANIAQIERLIREHAQRTTLTARWLQAKYPICFSNRMDPLATNNIEDATHIVELLVAADIPIQFQTRGYWPSRRNEACVQRMLALLPATYVWYVTVEIWDEAIREKVTPAAPRITNRLALIEELVAANQRVVVGFNPVVPEWLPGDHVEVLLEALRARGVSGVWIERLHFSGVQQRAMTQRERATIGEVLIKRTVQRETQPPDRAILDRARIYAQQIGLEIFSVGQPNRSSFFAPYHASYRTIPTMQDFVNYCHEQHQPGDLIDFAEFARFFVPHLPTGVIPIDSYLGATARQLWRTHQVPAQMTFGELLAIFFQDLRCKQCPARLPSFAFAAVWDNDGWIQLVDGDGMPYLVWSPTGHGDFYAHIRANV